jgi:hypothetical protein
VAHGKWFNHSMAKKKYQKINKNKNKNSRVLPHGP